MIHKLAARTPLTVVLVQVSFVASIAVVSARAFDSKIALVEVCDYGLLDRHGWTLRVNRLGEAELVPYVGPSRRIAVPPNDVERLRATMDVLASVSGVELGRLAPMTPCIERGLSFRNFNSAGTVMGWTITQVTALDPPRAELLADTRKRDILHALTQLYDVCRGAIDDHDALDSRALLASWR